MSNFSFPFRIIRDSPAVAGEVQGNFDALLAWIRTNLVQIDDSVRMTAQLTLPGAPTNANHAANKAYVDSVLPVGVMLDYVAALPPAGWLLCDGQAYTETEYPALWAIIGRTYTDAAVPSGQFQVPDFRDRTAVGPTETLTLGTKTGTKNVPAHSHTSPAHRHPIPHGHTASSVGETQEHQHNIDHGHSSPYQIWAKDVPGSWSLGSIFTDFQLSGASQHRHFAELWDQTGNVGFKLSAIANAVNNLVGALSGGRTAAHTHGITVNGHTGDSGDASPSTNSTGDANDNRPPSLVANKIIKAV